jgi:hypothetical protein
VVLAELFVPGRPALLTDTAFLTGVVFWAIRLAVTVFAAVVAASARTSFFAVFLTLAQRFFCAATSFARPAGLKVRTGVVFAANVAGSKLVALLDEIIPAGRPGFRLASAPVPLISALACSSREI